MATEPDYFIATFDTRERPHPWRWELKRHSKPMGVIVGRSGYQSQSAQSMQANNIWMISSRRLRRNSGEKIRSN